MRKLLMLAACGVVFIGLNRPRAYGESKIDEQALVISDKLVERAKTLLHADVEVSYYMAVLSRADTEKLKKIMADDGKENYDRLKKEVGPVFDALPQNRLERLDGILQLRGDEYVTTWKRLPNKPKKGDPVSKPMPQEFEKMLEIQKFSDGGVGVINDGKTISFYNHEWKVEVPTAMNIDMSLGPWEQMRLSKPLPFQKITAKRIDNEEDVIFQDIENGRTSNPTTYRFDVKRNMAPIQITSVGATHSNGGPTEPAGISHQWIFLPDDVKENPIKACLEIEKYRDDQFVVKVFLVKSWKLVPADAAMQSPALPENFHIIDYRFGEDPKFIKPNPDDVKGMQTLSELSDLYPPVHP